MHMVLSVNIDRHTDEQLEAEYLDLFSESGVAHDVAEIRAVCAAARAAGREAFPADDCTNVLPSGRCGGCPNPLDVPLPEGFLGKPDRTLSLVRDGVHELRGVECVFPDGHRAPYVIVSERHPGEPPRSRLLAVSTLVHLAYNVGENEVWQIEGRDPAPIDAERGVG